MRRRLGVVVVCLVACAAAATVTATPAAASHGGTITPPINVQPPITTQTPPGVQCFATVDCSWNPPPHAQKTGWKVGVARGTFPRLSALSTITLAAGAFSLGWKIGRVIDTKFLHLSGNIGTTAPQTVGGYTFNLHSWQYLTSLTTSGADINAPVWRLRWFNSSQGVDSGSVYDPTPSTAYNNSNYPALNAVYYNAPGSRFEYASGTACSGNSIFTSGGTNNNDHVCYYIVMSESTGVATDTVTNPNGLTSIYSPVTPSQGPEDFTNQPFTRTDSHPLDGSRTQNPSSTDAENDRLAISSQTNLKDEFNCVHDPAHFSCPDGNTGEGGGQVQYLNVPNCVGMTYPACVSALQAAGHVGTITRVDRTEPDLSVFPNRVTATNPAGGSSITTGATVVVTVNVEEDAYPFTLPQLQPQETPSAYTTRLYTLYPWLTDSSLVVTTSTITTTDAPGYDPERGPGELVDTNPNPGTSTTVTQTPEIILTRNPLDAPEPTLGAPGGPATSCDGYLEADLNMGPLMDLDLGERFPFGVVVYLADVLGAFSATPDAPVFSFTIPMPAVGEYGGDDFTFGPVDLNVLDEYMETLRAIFSVFIWVAGLWMLGTSLIGFKRAGDVGDGFEEAGF